MCIFLKIRFFLVKISDSIHLFKDIDGKDGMVKGKCTKRVDSAPLDDRSKSLILVNHFKTIPISQATCVDNSADLINMLGTCYGMAGSRWANFVAVDYYKVKSFTMHSYRLCSWPYTLIFAFI